LDLQDVQQVRKFGGKTSGFASRAEEAFEKRHLKAYLAGKSYFRCGYKIEKGRKRPVFYKVKVIYEGIDIQTP
jgi:hypothetical protein